MAGTVAQLFLGMSATPWLEPSMVALTKISHFLAKAAPARQGWEQLAPGQATRSHTLSLLTTL